MKNHLWETILGNRLDKMVKRQVAACFVLEGAGGGIKGYIHYQAIVLTEL